MKPYLCVYAVWLWGNLATAVVLQVLARRRVGVPLKVVWGGFAMSVAVVVVWGVSLAVLLVAADRSGIPATNGDVVTTCALWSAVPMVLTFALHVAGIARTLKAPRRP